MAMPPPMAMPYFHHTPSSPEDRRFSPNPDDMGDGDREDVRVTRTSNQLERPQTTPRPHAATASRQKLVFTDPVAFRYLEEDPDTIVLDRRRRLEGYELYIVEQWACSRNHPTFLICTYTGDASRSVIVSVLSVPSDASAWSPRLKLYLDAMSQYHAKPKETPYGDILITNLSGFPSSLTVISVSDGDVKKHREDFIVNEDLKRMGCTGRAAINLLPPQQSTVAKFHQLYRTSESAGIYQAVIELVKLCQKALLIYGRLQEAYTDGLLCDITEKAIGDWWTEIGVYFYNTEPTDGVLGPSTVAALLGLLIGAYNRLKAWGAPVGKDIFDIPSMKRAIGSFQKAAKLERSRRLDRETIDRLHRATAKTASGEGWTVPRAVKSTLAEVSGKGGEMVMGIVGGKDKAGISDVETLDIDLFAQLVVGARMKWLWQGKSKPVDVRIADGEGLEGKIFSTDDQGGFIWTSNKRDSVQGTNLERADTTSTLAPPSAEGKSGLNRIRDAVGGKLHNPRPLHEREETSDWNDTPTPGLSAVSSRLEPTSTPDDPLHPPLDQALVEASPYAHKKSPSGHTERERAHYNLQGPPATRQSLDHVPAYRQQLRPAAPASSPRKRQIEASLSALRTDLQNPTYTNFSTPYTHDEPQSHVLRRSRSAIQPVATTFADFPRQNRLNRQLSFSIVEPSILTFSDLVTDDAQIAPFPKQDGVQQHSPAAAMAARDALTAHAVKRSRRISQIQQSLIPFTESQVAHVEALDNNAAAHLEELNNMYYQKLEEYQTLRATSSDVVSQERGTLNDSLRRIEVLGAKLDYELNALQSRMAEVEAAVGEFEGSVVGIERRVGELVGGGSEERHEGVPWTQRLINFLGSGK
ncbi:uncharacterized protein HMPREF1541_09183 [Cyphellophora europaea CBS 101466]|uniref:STB6-like N-terminal domain-containing protein n=1 Tax=Cyphellophora europaea (strain CBS 101466) TaxID=1220924 RepID=W2S9J9_CYPE1|nr:uncharacterized protein HMPREF1541_09183 [Cyphellophora europaea CBS 101466]ETN45352.1 hypothetical protein HMPREF1541_09183 [Cyphellophora europaea CBS 101466]